MFGLLCCGTLATHFSSDGPAGFSTCSLSLTTLIMVPATGMSILPLSPKHPSLAVQMAAATALAEVLASANSNLGPLWVDHPTHDQSATLDILDTFCPGGNVRWPTPSTQDIQNHPQSSNVLVGSACNPTTLSIVAYICSVLDRTHEWLPHIQAKDTLSAASATGLHAWGLMLPTSTRTPGVCYTCTVAVRYDPLCTLLQGTQTWRIGTHLQRLNFALALNTLFKTNSFQNQEREKEERRSVWRSQLLRGSSSPAR